MEQTCSFSFDEIEVSTSYVYIFRVQAVGVGNTIGRLGSGRLLVTASQAERGWYRNTTSGNYFILANQDAVAKKVYSSDLLTNKLSADILSITPKKDSYDGLEISYAVNGLVLDLNGSNLITDKTAKPITQKLTFASTTTRSITLVSQNLVYTSNQSAGVFASVKLKDGVNFVKNITNCVVKRTDNQAILTEGIDYKLFANEGKITGINSSVASLLVDISFSYTEERMDMVILDPATITASIIQGIERKIDCIEEPYRPQKPFNSTKKLLNVIVRGNTLSVIETYKWNGIFKINKEAELIRDIEISKRFLPKTLAKLNTGQPVTIASYCHSIFAFQYSATGASPGFPPNGVIRDLMLWLEKNNFQPDFLATIPTYDFNDGAGQVHVKLSAMWHLKSYLEKTYGSNITYDNYSIGGSNSSADTSVNGALVPARLAEITSRAPHLVLVNFAINEISSTSTYENYRQIITALKAVGSEVIVWAGIETVNNSFSLSRSTLVAKSNVLKQLAFDMQCAYVPVLYFQDDNFSEIDSLSACAQNLYNHPGPWEHKKMGEMLTIFF